MDIPAGLILDPPNLKPWQNVPVRQHIHDDVQAADRVSERRQRRGLRRVLGRRRPGRAQHGAVHARHRRRRRHHHRRPGARGRAQPRRRARPHEDRDDQPAAVRLRPLGLPGGVRQRHRRRQAHAGSAGRGRRPRRRCTSCCARTRADVPRTSSTRPTAGDDAGRRRSSRRRRSTWPSAR